MGSAPPGLVVLGSRSLTVVAMLSRGKGFLTMLGFEGGSFPFYSLVYVSVEDGADTRPYIRKLPNVIKMGI